MPLINGSGRRRRRDLQKDIGLRCINDVLTRISFIS